MGDLDNFFESYLSRASIFREKAVLQSSYIPDQIAHRDEQINTIASILAPSLRNERPSNLFIYGKTGSGKTLTVNYTAANLHSVAERKKIPLTILSINCKLKKVADTDYRLLAELARQCGKSVPATGLPTDEVYKILFEAIDAKPQTYVLILDEIDQLVRKAGDEIIYNLTRINCDLKQSQICLVGISNDLTFQNNIDPRVKSSLSEEEIIFPPYNALHLQEILTRRCERAFKPGVLDDGVIAKCAAYSARDHGDARRALELIRVAGELADRDQQPRVALEHIDAAEEKIERDRIFDAVMNQPKQVQATLYAIICAEQHSKNDAIFTGEIYTIYRELCDRTGLRPLTQRRTSDILAELDMLGIINATIISKGRFGRTREVSLAMPEQLKQRLSTVLQQELLSA